MKTCRDCAESKPIADFPKSSKKVRSQCKTCYNIWQKEYWANREPRPLPDTKLCRACGIVKPATDFAKAGNKGSGLHANCKGCTAFRRRQEHINHPEKFRMHYAALDESTGRMVKLCPRCSQIKPTTAFYPLGNGRIRSACKECEIKAQAATYTRRFGRKREYAPRPGMSPEELREARRGYNRKRLPQQLAHNQARIARMTPEERARYNAMVRESKRRYAKANPQVKRAIEKRRRARKANAPIVEHITHKERAAIIERDGSRCYLWCGRVLIDSEITLDHVIPLKRGGPHTADNLRVACRSCNSRKATRLLSEM